jgi:hypothetical protein
MFSTDLSAEWTEPKLRSSLPSSNKSFSLGQFLLPSSLGEGGKGGEEGGEGGRGGRRGRGGEEKGEEGEEEGREISDTSSYCNEASTKPFHRGLRPGLRYV